MPRTDVNSLRPNALKFTPGVAGLTLRLLRLFTSGRMRFRINSFYYEYSNFGPEIQEYLPDPMERCLAKHQIFRTIREFIIIDQRRNRAKLAGIAPAVGLWLCTSGPTLCTDEHNEDKIVAHVAKLHKKLD